MSRTSITLLVAAGMVLILLGASIAAIRGLGRWLVVADPLPPALDILYTLGGDSERYVHSKELARRYPGAFWVISIGDFPVFDTLTFSTIVKRNVVLSGFDTTRVFVNDTCRSTGGEIELLASLVDRAGTTGAACLRDSGGRLMLKGLEQDERFDCWFSSPRPDTVHVGIVTHHYHTRRVKLLAEREFATRPVALSYIPVPYGDDANEFYRGRKWWRNESDASFIIGEVIKILYYSTIRKKVTVTP